MKTMPSSRPLACAAALATAASCVLLAAPAGAVTFDSGHIDAFNVTADSPDSLTLDLKEDITGTGVRQAPEDVVIAVGPQAYTDSTESVAGIDRPTWYLPLTQASDLPWPGWDTNGVRAEGFTTIDIEFEEVSGPGNIFLYSNDTFGQTEPVLADGSAWLSTGSVLRQESPGHVHANWAFDAPGTYQLVVSATGVSEAGEQVRSNTATYTFEVDPEAEGSAGASGVEHGGQAASADAAEEGEADHGGAAAQAPAAAGHGGGAAKAAKEAPAAPGAARAGQKGAPGQHASGSAAPGSPRSAAEPMKSPRTSLVSEEESIMGLTYRSWTFLILALLVCGAGSGYFYYQRRKEQRSAEDGFENAASAAEAGAAGGPGDPAVGPARGPVGGPSGVEAPTEYLDRQ